MKKTEWNGDKIVLPSGHLPLPRGLFRMAVGLSCFEAEQVLPDMSPHGCTNTLSVRYADRHQGEHAEVHLPGPLRRGLTIRGVVVDCFSGGGAALGMMS